MATLITQPPEWIHTAPVQASATREIAAAADEVFTALADHEAWPEWFDALTKVERFGDLHEGIGSKRRVFIGKKLVVEEEFNVWEPNKEWGFMIFESSIGVLKSMSELVTIQEIGPDRVRVTYKMGLAPKFGLAPVLRLGKRGIVKNLGKALDGLSEHLAARRAA